MGPVSSSQFNATEFKIPTTYVLHGIVHRKLESLFIQKLNFHEKGMTLLYFLEEQCFSFQHPAFDSSRCHHHTDCQPAIPGTASECMCDRRAAETDAGLKH